MHINLKFVFSMVLLLALQVPIVYSNSTFLNFRAEAESDVSNKATSKPDKSPDMTSYMSGVTKKIQTVWRHPDVPTDCTVSILFSVDKNGALVSNAVKKSSGVASVDQLALQTIKKSAPFAKLPEGTGKFSVEYSFACGPRKSADAYMFNGVPIKNQEYKMSSGGATLHNLETDSPAERKLQEKKRFCKKSLIHYRGA